MAISLQNHFYNEIADLRMMIGLA